jgi:hypothetical protein
MTLISTATVGAGGASTISISSIPQTFTDLQIVISARSSFSGTEDFCRLTFNSTTSGYSGIYVRGTGSAAQSFTIQTTNIRLDVPAATSTANTFGNAQYYVPNYAGSTNKTVSVDYVTENNNSTAYQYLIAGLWSNGAGITSVSIDSANAANFVQYSTMSIYGILKGSGGATVS